MRKVFILSASFLLLLQACNKDGQLVPEFEENTTFSFFSDTAVIATTTLIGEPVTADQIAIGLAGEYRDSSFGYTKSSIYVQPVLSSNVLQFGDLNTISVDSVILSVEYSGYFGDTAFAQTFNVFRLTDTLDVSTTYLSNTVKSTEGTPLATRNFFAHPARQVKYVQPDNNGSVSLDSARAQLRFNLGTAIGDEIISKQNQDELANSPNFVRFFKGLKITPEENPSLMNNESAILYFSLTSSNTKMTIYYTEDTTRKAVDLPINTSSVRFNAFEHNYFGSAVENALQNPLTDLTYVQAMAGVETNIKFPELKEKLGGKILVNKAELVLPAAGGSYAVNNVGKAEKLVVASREGDDNALTFIRDFNTELFGGEYDETNDQYVFTITRYIQNYLNGSENENGLTLLVSGSAVRAERAVIRNENNSNDKIRLNLYYTNTQ